MYKQDEERESVWAAIYEKHMSDSLAEMWSELNEDGSGLTGAEVEACLNGDAPQMVRAFVVMDLIRSRLHAKAKERADSEVDAVYSAMLQSRRASQLKGTDHEDLV